MRRIILLIDCESEYDRKLLRGLVRYSKEHGPWQFYRMPSRMRENLDGGRFVIEWAKKWKADAIVGRWRWKDTFPLSRLSIPVVLQNYNSRSSCFSNLTGDYIGTGVLAARFFASRRYCNFAYLGVKDVVWSEERLQGFREEVQRQGGKLFSLMVLDTFREQKKVEKWLLSLPKPVALFACDDSLALFVAETCKVVNICIPEELALLGVDNDELLCQISEPQISSINLNVEHGGYRLGEMLDKQFESKDNWSFNLVISHGEITQRGSTGIHNVKNPHVDKMLRFIEDNYDQFITSEQVFKQVPLSRRGAEIRFKREMGDMTVYRYLTECRMNKFVHLLATTDMSMAEISDRCGIVNYSNIPRVFKKIYGCTPVEYRKEVKKERDP